MRTTAYLEQCEVGVLVTLPPAKQPPGSRRHQQCPVPAPLEPAAGPLGIEPLRDGRQFVPAGPTMRSIRGQVAAIAQVDLPVLLVGGTGAGKGIVARLIHDLSPRRDRPFQKLRCSDFREDVLERELFGSTGKDNSGLRRWQLGRLNACQGGTLVLDEITALRGRLQARLVDVLDSQRLPAVGDSLQTPLDVRILATIREDGAQAVASGKLRRDLYYRLHCLTLRLPPLRERKEDTSTLLHHWLTRNSPAGRRRAPEALEALQQACLRYTWPGNSWEFEDFVKRWLHPGQDSVALTRLEERARLSA